MLSSSSRARYSLSMSDSICCLIALGSGGNVFALQNEEESQTGCDLSALANACSQDQKERGKKNAHRIDDEVDELDPGRRLLALHDPDNGGVEKMASVVKDSSLGSLVLFRLWRDGDRV
jgi:hypothetical protein